MNSLWCRCTQRHIWGANTDPHPDSI